jgi:hypothetical protein
MKGRLKKGNKGSDSDSDDAGKKMVRNENKGYAAQVKSKGAGAKTGFKTINQLSEMQSSWEDLAKSLNENREILSHQNTLLRSQIEKYNVFLEKSLYP